jgi:nicotinamide mononucleotide transporter
MENLLSINTVMFTVMGYPMSYIEFFGTIFNLWCVWLVAKNKILNWPVGIVGTILYVFLFYQIRLYSDLFEQIYFFITSIYGWILWSNLRDKKENRNKLKITQNSQKSNWIYLWVIVVGTVVLGAFMERIDIIFPQYFQEPASFPYLDAFTTVMSFAATILIAQKKVECWYLWILVDIIGIGLYYAKGVKFISLEYLIFLVLATKGLIQWQREFKSYAKKKNENTRAGLGEIRSASQGAPVFD